MCTHVPLYHPHAFALRPSTKRHVHVSGAHHHKQDDNDSNKANNARLSPNVRRQLAATADEHEGRHFDAQLAATTVSHIAGVKSDDNRHPAAVTEHGDASSRGRIVHTDGFRYEAEMLVVDELEAANVFVENSTRIGDNNDDDDDDDVADADAGGGMSVSGYSLHNLMANASGRTVAVLSVFGVCAVIYSSKWELIIYSHVTTINPRPIHKSHPSRPSLTFY